MKGIFSISVAILTLLSFSVQGQVALVNINSPAGMSSLPVAKPLTSSFSLRSGKIIVDLWVDGKQGKYLLDTGADAFLINAIPSKTNAHEAVGLCSSAQAEMTRVKELNWGNNSFNELTAYKVDLSSLEASIGIQLDGVVGQSLLSLGALHVDYQKQLLTFMPSPKPRDLKKEGWKSFNLYQVGHLLTLAIKVNGQKLFMGLDTGAEINLLAKPCNIAVADQDIKKIMGINGHGSTAYQVEVSEVEVNNKALEIGGLYYSPNESFDERFDGQLSGLLGFPFFENNAFLLDLSNKILYLR